MPNRTKSYNDWLINRLADPCEAERYLKNAIADSPARFFKALRKVAAAKRMARVAEETGLNRESLYKALSEDGNPGFTTIEAVLKAVGMTLVPALISPTPNQPVPPVQTGEQAGGVTNTALTSQPVVKAANEEANPSSGVFVIPGTESRNYDSCGDASVPLQFNPGLAGILLQAERQREVGYI